MSLVSRSFGSIRQVWLHVLRRSADLGPLSVVIFTALCGVLILASFRGLLTLQYIDLLQETPGYLKLFPVGLRMDVILLSYLLMLPAGLLLLLPKTLLRRLRFFICIYLTGFVALMVYMEIATFPFIAE